MTLLHGSFLLPGAGEAWLANPQPHPALSWTMLVALVGTMTLRYWAIATLGERWNTRVIVVPGLEPVRTGPYRWIRHPNYVAVAIELFALPLIGGCYVTALCWGTANLFLLRHRIRVEEEALVQAGGYQELANQPRFMPRSKP